jgi:predicted DNA binding CopG/RHH family protein
MKKMRNCLPEFKNEDEERAFWATHSPLDYFDTEKRSRESLPRLKPSLKSISIRVPSDMLAELKTLANKKDVPYQSLAKVYIARQIGLNADPWGVLPGKGETLRYRADKQGGIEVFVIFECYSVSII